MNFNHSAISVEAISTNDAVVYFAEAGEAQWSLRNDVSEGNKFQLRYHGQTGAQTRMLSADATNGQISAHSNTVTDYRGFPQPDYNSGWVSINPAETRQLTHNVGGSADDYLVDLQFKDSGAFGTNIMFLGGTPSPDNSGGWYAKLTSTTLDVTRRGSDS